MVVCKQAISRKDWARTGSTTSSTPGQPNVPSTCWVNLGLKSRSHNTANPKACSALSQLRWSNMTSLHLCKVSNPLGMSFLHVEQRIAQEKPLAMRKTKFRLLYSHKFKYDFSKKFIKLLNKTCCRWEEGSSLTQFIEWDRESGAAKQPPSSVSPKNGTKGWLTD